MNLPIGYSRSQHFCEKLTDKFWDDRFLSFKSMTCDTVKQELHIAAKLWTSVDIADVTLQGVTPSLIHVLAGPTEKSLLGFAQRTNETHAILTLSDAVCWYTDREFCQAVSDNDPRWFLLGAWCTLFIFSVLLVALGRCLPWTWIVCTANLLWPPMLYWSAIRPCEQCYDFRAVAAHEFGHALGFGHPDDGANFCGCNITTECDVDVDSIMTSHSSYKETACLSRGDQQGMKHIYDMYDRCDLFEPCWTYVNYAGWSRALSALTLSLIIAITSRALVITYLKFYPFHLSISSVRRGINRTIRPNLDRRLPVLTRARVSAR